MAMTRNFSEGLTPEEALEKYRILQTTGSAKPRYDSEMLQFLCSLPPSNQYRSLIEEIRGNGLKNNPDSFHLTLHKLTLTALLLHGCEKEAIDIFINLSRQGNAYINSDMCQTILGMLCEADIDAAPKYIQAICESAKELNVALDQKYLQRVIEYAIEKQDHAMVKITLSIDPNIQFFYIAATKAVNARNIILMQTICNALPDNISKNTFYSFALRKAINAEDSEMAAFLYKKASQNNAVDDELELAYIHARTFLPPTQKEIEARLEELEESPGAGEPITKSESALLDAAVFNQIIMAITLAAAKNKNRAFLEKQRQMALLICPPDKIDELYKALIASAINCEEFDYTAELYKECIKGLFVLANDPDFCHTLLQIFSAHKRLEDIEETYMHLLYLLNGYQEDLGDTITDKNVATIRNIHNTAIRALGKFEKTFNQACSIFSTLTTHQNGRFANYTTYISMFMAALDNNNHQLAHKVFQNALKRPDCLSFQSALILEVANNPHHALAIAAMYQQGLQPVESHQVQHTYSYEGPTLSTVLSHHVYGAALEVEAERNPLANIAEESQSDYENNEDDEGDECSDDAPEEKTSPQTYFQENAYGYGRLYSKDTQLPEPKKKHFVLAGPMPYTAWNARDVCPQAYDPSFPSGAFSPRNRK